MQNSLNGRDAKSDVIPEAYKLWTRQHAVWGQSISISTSGEWLGFHSTVQCAYPSLKMYICINRMSQKKVRNEFSSLSLSKIAKIIRTTHNRGFNGGRSASWQGGVPSLKIQKLPFFGTPCMFLTVFWWRKMCFIPNTFSPWIQINILIFYKQDIRCKGWREHARVGTRT